MAAKFRYMRYYYFPNIKYDLQQRVFLKEIGSNKRLYKYELRIEYSDEMGNSCTQPCAKYAKIKSVNGIPYNAPERIFMTRLEIQEAAYMFIYTLYNLANHLADIENKPVAF